MAIDISLYIDKAWTIIKSYAPQVGYALLFLLLGWWAINIFMSILGRIFIRRKVDQSMSHFLTAVIGILLKILLIVSAISLAGIPTTSFVAALAAAGFAIGLALQGSLSNFAGGVLILIFKPFRVGHYIEAQGVNGTVKKIDIINTVINTPDNKRIIIPNGPLANDVIINFTAERTRRVDMTFSISYNDNIQKARKIIEKLLNKDERVLKDPNYQIVIGMLNASSVDFTVRAWTETKEYWNVFFEMQEKVKQEFDKAGISIPFPQQDVHIYNHKGK